MPSTIYKELPPPRELSRYVSCLWFQTVGDEALLHLVVPDACSDIVAVEGRAPSAVGPAVDTVLVPLAARTSIVGARFRPGMTAVGFGVPADELLGVDAPLDSIWKAEAARELDARLAEARTVPERLRILARQLIERAGRQRPIDPFVETAVRRIAAVPHRPVGTLLDAELGGRQALRRFRASVGYGPKMLQRILRFQRLLVLSSRRVATLSQLALDAGYVDQAHMGREVVALSGQTPKALLKRPYAATAMSDFFKTVDGSNANLSA